MPYPGYRHFAPKVRRNQTVDSGITGETTHRSHREVSHAPQIPPASATVQRATQERIAVPDHQSHNPSWWALFRNHRTEYSMEGVELGLFRTLYPATFTSPSVLR